MNLFFKYLKEKRLVFVTYGIFIVIFTVTFFLYRLPLAAVMYPAVLCAAVGITVTVLDFLKIKHTHEELCGIYALSGTAGCSKDASDKTFPHAEDYDSAIPGEALFCSIASDFPADSSLLGADYRLIIDALNNTHIALKNTADSRYCNMINYYTVWAHQIKTPIASMRLTLQNEDSALSRRLKNDLNRIEQYVEMVMTYLRLDSAATDYVFKEYPLDEIVKSAVKKFSSEFITKNLQLHYKPLDICVFTDEKWLSFVIEQVLSNALKYTHHGSITIEMSDTYTLSVTDTGIGISATDLPRIFENGYTGFNGRTDKKASGIGLYLCKRICDNLGHKITVKSAPGVGTSVYVDMTKTKREFE